MAGPLRMPNEDEVPPGPHREFLGFLFHYYGLAGRPPLEEISDRVNRLELAGTASKETIRRVLKGRTLSRWKNIDAIFKAFCAMSDLDSNDSIHPPQGGFMQPRWQILRSLWNDAVDPPEPEQPREVGRIIEENPFGVTDSQQGTRRGYIPSPEKSGGGFAGFSDEPPF